jgi:hypothetical protein
MILTGIPFVLRLSKDERETFQQLNSVKLTLRVAGVSFFACK